MTTRGEDTRYHGVLSTGGRPARRRRNPRGPARKLLHAPPVDFACREIKPGDLVTVPDGQWSSGTARWMERSLGTVISVARTRAEVQFQGLPHTHHVPARSLHIVADETTPDR